MVIAVEDSVETIWGNEEARYAFVFTEASTERNGTAYTAVIGENAYMDDNSRRLSTIDGDLSAGGLYIINISPSRLCSRVYGGTVKFQREGNTYFAVVFPDWTILEQLGTVQRWRFKYISFEYPRRGKKGFLLPAINSSPFAYCFITEEEREVIEHLCPPMPVARYTPEEYGYEKEELLRYLGDKEEKRQHADELYPIVHSIFERSGGDKEQYTPIDKALIPEEYHDYQLLYNAESLWDW